ncbi:GGDEF domain-containing protein [Carboxydothermus ferrireducens]|uniref:Diguanylate cyclase (GGDEF)-like protein n=1 Tax=Carboxydothermus ferrireducens DSM 11255 TaxID=1119529 RepID=A0ABX2R6R7_9THEO|nr:GGDEF domain-containing protein [Carboxydothermus ferrireducens]NYE56854.1 diguanylate cyclase (GGDEF)-like protein [Carboxydothermus ferrireducens DSM 11255]
MEQNLIKGLILLLLLIFNVNSPVLILLLLTLSGLIFLYNSHLNRYLSKPMVVAATYFLSSLYFTFNWNDFASYPLIFLLNLSLKSVLFFPAIFTGMLLSTIFYHTPFDLTSIFKPFLTIALTEVLINVNLKEKNSQRENYSAEEVRELLNLSYTDNLTGLYNRHFLENEAKIIDRQTSQSNFEYAILMADIDFFKQYNDSLGHLAGDEALKKIAGIIKNSVRKQDKVFRFGGEEFLILLPETSPEKARQIAERIRSSVARDLELSLTVSIGIGHFPQNGKSFREVLKAADSALYQAKNKGRNTVCLLKV